MALAAPVILIIAGTDSSGGAGLARDIATAACAGVSTALAVTAVTAQTHHKVLHMEPVCASLITRQITSAFAANSISAIKIGMLGTAKAARALSPILKTHGDIPVIFDPVLAASSKDRLARGDMRDAIVHNLLPQVTLITPNIAELAELTLSEPARDENGAIEQAGALIRLGACAVLAKGGHAAGSMATDHLLVKGCSPVNFSHRRIHAVMRGTGCTLSTLIAANMALGLPLDKAVGIAKQHVHTLLKNRARR